MAPTTSVGGTAKSPFEAASSSTRPVIISTSSTGGWALGPRMCMPWVLCRSTARTPAAGHGESYTYGRYTGNTTSDPFALDLERSPMLTGLYRDAEEETGYLRDRNVFGPDISIEDTMVVSARYRSGALAQLLSGCLLPLGGASRVQLPATRGGSSCTNGTELT